MVLLLLAGIALGQRLAPSHGSEAFYSAAAQVIPVLLLVLALEARLFRLRAPSWPAGLRSAFIEAAVLGVTLLFFVLGEVRALGALGGEHARLHAREHAGDEDPSTVYTAVLLGMLMIGFIAVFGLPRRTEEQPA